MPKLKLAVLSLFTLVASSIFSQVCASETWKPSYYMDHPAPVCRSILPSDPLASNPVIQPYLQAAKDSGWNIKQCSYPFSTKGDKSPDDRTGWVVLADPPPSILEKWIRSACVKKAPKISAQCETDLKVYVNGQNGGQFPVIGYVSEGGKELCKQKGIGVPETGLIAFQDGITVQHFEQGSTGEEAIYCNTDLVEPAQQSEWARTRKIAEVYSKIRLSGLDASCVKISPEISAQAASKGLEPKLLVSRVNHLSAMQTGTDRFLEIQAERYAKAGKSVLGAKCAAPFD